AIRAPVLSESGQSRGQAIYVLRAELASRPRFQRAEVELQANDGKMRVQRRADVDRAIEYLHGRVTLLKKTRRGVTRSCHVLFLGGNEARGGGGAGTQ